MTVGDRLLLYTDGLSEARDERGEYLPLLQLAPLLRESSVEDALDGILAKVREHVPDGQLTDDLAALLLENALPDGDPQPNTTAPWWPALTRCSTTCRRRWNT